MMEHSLPKPFPNETPTYRAARNKLLKAESDLRAAVETVAEQRRELPLGGLISEDYCFDEWNGGHANQTRLSELFAPGKDSLILYSFMYGPNDDTPCPACTALLDGWNGTAPHVMDRANLAIVSSSPIERFAALAQSRNWNRFRLLSSSGNDYNDHYLGQSEDGGQRPMCSVFTRTAQGIHHFWSSELIFAKSPGHPRHMDLAWPLWNILDLLPEGRGTDWFPKLAYD